MSDTITVQRNALLAMMASPTTVSAALHRQLVVLGGTRLDEWAPGSMQVIEEHGGGQCRVLLGSITDTVVRAVAIAIAAASEREVHTWISFGSAKVGGRLRIDCSVSAVLVSPAGEYTALATPALDSDTLAYVDEEARAIPLEGLDVGIALAKFTSHALQEAANTVLPGFAGGPTTTTHYAFATELPARLQTIVDAIRGGASMGITREPDGRWRLALVDDAGKRTSFLSDDHWRAVAGALGRNPDKP